MYIYIVLHYRITSLVQRWHVLIQANIYKKYIIDTIRKVHLIFYINPVSNARFYRSIFYQNKPFLFGDRIHTMDCHFDIFRFQFFFCYSHVVSLIRFRQSSFFVYRFSDFSFSYQNISLGNETFPDSCVKTKLHLRGI